MSVLSIFSFVELKVDNKGKVMISIVFLLSNFLPPKGGNAASDNGGKPLGVVAEMPAKTTRLFGGKIL